MIHGYARASTAAQELAPQLAQLKAAGCEKVFREGHRHDRRPSAASQGNIRSRSRRRGCHPAVDRLSRDTTDLLMIAREIQRARAGICSLAEPLLDTTSDFAKIVFAILGITAKLERRRISERTEQGRADARAKGVKLGRKPKLTEHQPRGARARVAAGETQRSVARSYNVSQSTISWHALPVGGI